jgi:hypothetical protein
MHTHSFITMLNFLIDYQSPLNGECLHVHFKASRPITNSSKWRVASRPITTSNGEWLHVHFKALCPITTSNGEWLHVHFKALRPITTSNGEWLRVHFKASRPITTSNGEWLHVRSPPLNGEWLHVHFKASRPITTSNGEWLHVRIKTSCRMIVVSGFEPLDSFCATGSHSSYAHDVNTGVN